MASPDLAEIGEIVRSFPISTFDVMKVKGVRAMTTYDPERRDSREELAAALLTKLESCGFVPEKRDKTSEAVFARDVDGAPGIRVLVYTSVVARRGSMQARPVGSDAIRVCAVFKARDGKDRGIISAKRVHRTGKVEDIVDRMYKRMREVYKAAKTGSRCHCGAPKFLSKRGHDVCADLCWLPEEELSKPSPHPGSRRWRRTG